MHQIEIKVRFRAGHRLMEPYKGKCNNPHGEGYTAILFFETQDLNRDGMVLDFGVVKKDAQNIVDHFYDHSFIFNENDKKGNFPLQFSSLGYRIYLMRGNPTAENIAKDLFIKVKKQYPELKRVGIVESFDDSIAWYEEDIKRSQQDEKLCTQCGNPVKYSEWCVFHFKKRRDFCSYECYKKFNDEYNKDKEVEDLRAL
jgi:6-pyruvoyltetrahydropterin/6-carboxytetrahydropterin synthase